MTPGEMPLTVLTWKSVEEVMIYSGYTRPADWHSAGHCSVVVGQINGQGERVGDTWVLELLRSDLQPLD